MALKVCVVGVILFLGLSGSEYVRADGTITMDAMPLYVAHGGTPFAVKFTVTGLVPNTDYTYTARIYKSGGTYGSFWSDHSGEEEYGWKTAYSTLGNTGAGTSLSAWAYVRSGTTVSTGSAFLRLRVRVKTSSDSPTPTDFPLTIMNMSFNMGFFHNAMTTGHAGKGVVSVTDSSGNRVGLVLAEPNGVDDDGDGTADNEDYGPPGIEGDFRVAIPSGMTLDTRIDGAMYAPSETVNAGEEKGIPSDAPVIEVSTPLVTHDRMARTIDIKGVVASCSLHGTLTDIDPPPSGPVTHSYAIFTFGNSFTGIKGNLSYTGTYWQALDVDVSELPPGEYNVKATLSDSEATGTSLPSSPNFRITQTIAQAKTKGSGSLVRVCGNVSVPKDTFSKNEVYIQDKTAGIKIYMEGSGIPGTVNLGDLVEVAGIIMSHKREREIHASEFINLGPGSPPLPSSLSTAACMLETNEGLLVSVTSAKVTSTGGGRFFIDDGSGPACVYIDYDTGINLSLYSGFGRGAIVRVTGVAGQYNSVHEIKPRFKEDILVLFPAPPPSVYNAEIAMKNMSYAAATNIEKVEALLNRAENLLRLAAEKELDTSGCDFLISEAERQIKRAKEVSQTNFIAANNFALKASVLLREAIRCLEILLG